ncbi:MAG: hypothetical protein JWR69_4704 [Pedosphaera sp.]|nr:hypothetical protein [Pedosphaera sp.]
MANDLSDSKLLRWHVTAEAEGAFAALVARHLPLVYQWNAISQARASADRMNQQLTTLEADVADLELAQTRAERRTAALEKQLDHPSSTGPAAARLAVDRSSEHPYLWDETSPYVRLPKEVLSQVRFAPFATRTARDGKTERY